MHWIDWAIVIGLLILLTAGALYAKRYMKSVAGFLAAERCAGRYLLTLAAGMAGIGAISIVAEYEMFYKAGFCLKWWEMMKMPVTIIIAATGWVVYRFRQTRAMTMPEFMEMRYSRKFRIYAGLICFLSGIINFGIFPSVGARFFMYFCDLPSWPVTLFGVFNIDLMFALIMFILITISLFFTFMGGQIAVIVTDFLQGAFYEIVSIIILIFLLGYFSWPQISEAMLMAPPEASMVHPFHTSEQGDFNATFYVIYIFILFYGYMSWQGTQGYSCSAKNAHEQKMAGVVTTWKFYVVFLLVLMVPICMYVLMHHPDFADEAVRANKMLDSISTDPDNTIRKQMTVPIALRTIMPVGLMGAMCAAMLAAFISTHDTYMHSWGSMFIQDVVMPFRKKPFKPEQHIRLLRWSIVGVAIFIYFFSLFYPLSQYIVMFFAITGAVIAGLGAVIIGGLYWKRGSTAAAYTTLTAGAVLALSALVYRKIDSDAWLNTTFNSMEQWMFIITICITLYVVVSLFGKTVFNLDKMLHRGKYAVQEPGNKIAQQQTDLKSEKETVISRVWGKFITKEFSKGDKILYAGTLGWALLWFAVFVAGTIYNLIVDVPNESWLQFWHVWIGILFVFTVVVTAWLLWGGIRNLKEMFALLREQRIDTHDDGWVERSDEKETETEKVY